MKWLVLSICISCLVSCTTKVIKAADFDRLPSGKGIDTGSLDVSPWEYGASDEQWHHFYYHWTAWNGTHTRQVKIWRELVSMPLVRPVGGYYKTVSMEPVLRDGRIVAFQTITGQWPRPVPTH